MCTDGPSLCLLSETEFETGQKYPIVAPLRMNNVIVRFEKAKIIAPLHCVRQSTPANETPMNGDSYGPPIGSRKTLACNRSGQSACIPKAPQCQLLTLMHRNCQATKNLYTPGQGGKKGVSLVRLVIGNRNSCWSC